MSDTSLATIEQPTRQHIAARDRSLPGKVTGRLKRAIEAMVWSAATRPDAAQLAGLTDHSLRQALRRPHVMAFYRAECEVLRSSGRARRIHRLESISEQDENKQAAVNAIKALDYHDETQSLSGAAVRPAGLTINIISRGIDTPSTPDRAPSTPDRAQVIDIVGDGQ